MTNNILRRMGVVAALTLTLAACVSLLSAATASAAGVEGGSPDASIFFPTFPGLSGSGPFFETFSIASVSTDATLSSLSISPGTLTPSFASDTLGYTATVASTVDSIDVTPVANDPNATIKVQGIPLSVFGGTTASVPLSYGSNSIPVQVTAQDGTTQETYTLTVTRLGATDADLAGLTLDNGTLTPTFSPSTTSYTAAVDNSVSGTGITPNTDDFDATTTINGQFAYPHNYNPVALAVGDNVFDIQVTATDGTTTKDYTVTITRAAPTLSSNADLSNLSLTAGSLSPSFASGTTSYTDSVAYAIDSIGVIPTAADAGASLTVNGQAAVSGNQTVVNLSVGDNTITIVTTAADGTTQKTYTLTVTRAASADADLSSLVPFGMTFNPSFSSGTTSYSVSVPYAKSDFIAIPTLDDASATLTVNGDPATSGSQVDVPLTVGLNAIDFVVTAQDGTTQKDYSFTVTRAAASTDADLANLVVSVPLDAGQSFAPGTTYYSASVGYMTDSVDITPTVDQPGWETMTVNGDPATSGQTVTVPLSSGHNFINVVTTAQDGTTQKTYQVEIVRDAASSDANLSNLDVGAPFDQAFSPSTTAYTASVGYLATSRDVTPTVEDATATVTVNGTAATSGSPVNVPLTVGDNTITIVVTAQDSSTKTYTVTITRYPASTDANLSNLAVSQGTFSPSFDPAITGLYTETVASSVSSIDVTPTLEDSQSSLTVDGDSATSGNAVTVPLTVGQNTITVVVTAQDGTTQKTYSLRVTRQASTDDYLASLGLSAGSLSPAFAQATTYYQVDVANGVSSIDVTPTVDDATATLEVDGDPATSGNTVTVPLTVGYNTITIKVTAQAGGWRTYTLSVHRANSSISTLDSITGVTLSPAFATGTTAYTATVAEGTTDLNLDPTPTAGDANMAVYLGGHLLTTTFPADVPLAVGDNAISIAVTSGDSTTETDYNIVVTRQGPEAASLTSLTALNAVNFSPAFDPATFSYTAAVANGVDEFDFRALTYDGRETVSVDGSPYYNGNVGRAPLAVGQNTINIVVTAGDGVTQKTYTFTITRAAAAQGGGNGGGNGGNGGGGSTPTPPAPKPPTLPKLVIAPGPKGGGKGGPQGGQKGGPKTDGSWVNSPTLDLSITAPDGTDKVDIAQRPDFKDGQTFPVAPDGVYHWTFDATPTKDGQTTIYVRFLDASGNVVGQVLSGTVKVDSKAPVNGKAAVTKTRKDGSRQRDWLDFKSSDDRSGVAFIQFALTPAHPWAWTRYRKGLTVDVKGKTIWYRTADAAGNISAWKEITLSAPKPPVKPSKLHGKPPVKPNPKPTVPRGKGHK